MRTTREIGSRQNGHSCILSAHSPQTPTCPHSSSTQSTRLSKHTLHSSPMTPAAGRGVVGDVAAAAAAAPAADGSVDDEITSAAAGAKCVRTQSSMSLCTRAAKSDFSTTPSGRDTWLAAKIPLRSRTGILDGSAWCSTSIFTVGKSAFAVAAWAGGGRALAAARRSDMNMANSASTESRSSGRPVAGMGRRSVGGVIWYARAYAFSACTGNRSAAVSALTASPDWAVGSGGNSTDDSRDTAGAQ
ncbi:hypothetical protein BC828DRAFT_173587 [Blastocladiella britannica]|nr:hypothetical protein BC828DRAFT_173587 [Blastocladiella britannica]